MSTDSPLVSIIIPCYNAAPYLAEAVRSSLEKSYPAIEVIIVDDGSTDGSAVIAEALVAQHPERLRLLRKANGGAASARNHGIEQSRGEYWLFLDADDLLVEGALAALVEGIQREEADVAVGDSACFDDSAPDRLFSHSPTFADPDDPLASVIASCPAVSAVLVRRNPRRFTEGMVVNEIEDYFWHLIDEASHTIYVPTLVTIYRQHAHSSRITQRYDHMEPAGRAAMISAFKRHLAAANRLTFGRCEALDRQLFGNLFALYQQRREREAEYLFDEISWSNFPRYGWYRRWGVTGFVTKLGPRTGLKSFYTINKVLNRV